jgi:hypothetical protein
MINITESMTGKRCLIKTSISFKEVFIEELSPSGQYVKLSAPGINDPWRLSSDIIVIEVLEPKTVK